MRDHTFEPCADARRAVVVSASDRACYKAGIVGLAAIILGLVILTDAVAQDRELETFILNGGRMIEGAIVDANRNTVAIRNEVGIAQIVRVDDIQTVYIPVRGSESRPFFGSFVAWEDGIYELNINFQLVKVKDGMEQSQPVPVDFKRTAKRRKTPTPAPSKLQPGASEPTQVVAEPPKAETDVTVATASDIPTLVVDVGESVEGVSHVTYRFVLSKPLEQSLFLAYRTVDGSAHATRDYVAERGVLTIPAGALEAELKIPLIDDDLAEDDKSFTLAIATGSDVVRVSRTQINTTIGDND